MTIDITRHENGCLHFESDAFKAAFCTSGVERPFGDAAGVKRFEVFGDLAAFSEWWDRWGESFVLRDVVR